MRSNNEIVCADSIAPLPVNLRRRPLLQIGASNDLLHRNRNRRLRQSRARLARNLRAAFTRLFTLREPQLQIIAAYMAGIFIFTAYAACLMQFLGLA